MSAAATDFFRLYMNGGRTVMDRISEGMLNEFSAEHELTTLPENTRFEHFAAYITTYRHYSEKFDTDDVVTGAGDDTGIDAIAIIVNGILVTDIDDFRDRFADGHLDVTFVFVQADRGSNFETAKMGQFGDGVRDFFRTEGHLRRNQSITDAASITDEIYKRPSRFKVGIPSCRLYYVTTGQWQNDRNLAARRAAIIEELRATNLFRDVDLVPIDRDRLHKFYRQTKHSIAVDFKFEKRVVLPQLEGVTQAFLGVLPVTEFMKLIGDEDGIYGELFYENVRDFGGYNNVNKEIAETVESPDRNRFALMNNGVTIIARHLLPTGDTFHIEDYAIVNGCQTSHVLFEKKAQLTDPTMMVPVRLIETTSDPIINSIIRSTNRQTEVKAEQFVAMTDFAKDLEAFCQSFGTDRRLYYERRPGQYASHDIKATLILPLHTMIRTYASMFLNEATRATKNYSSLKERVEKDIFAAGHRYEPYYTAALAFIRLQYFFRANRFDAKFKPAKYHILMAARIIGNPDPLPRPNAAEMARYCQVLMDKLWDPARADDLFEKAVGVVNQAADNRFDRDSVRTEPFTNMVRELSELLGGQHEAREG